MKPGLKFGQIHRQSGWFKYEDVDISIYYTEEPRNNQVMVDTLADKRVKESFHYPTCHSLPGLKISLKFFLL